MSCFVKERSWGNVRILVRGDSAYSREEIMSWCESQPEVDYVFGLAKNSRLIKMTTRTQNRAKQEYSQKLETVVSFLETLFTPDDELKKQASELIDSSIWYRSLDYQTQESWSRNRRVVSKVEIGALGSNIRFVVTSLPTDKVPPGELYTQKYCPRGEMENRFKEQQLELFSDRTSTHTFEGNQLRLWFSSVAYVLMNALREQCLASTELQNAQVGVTLSPDKTGHPLPTQTICGATPTTQRGCPVLSRKDPGTIRTKLLKLGALITVSSRRILIAISSSCPYQDIFATAYRCLEMLPVARKW